MTNTDFCDDFSCKYNIFHGKQPYERKCTHDPPFTEYLVKDGFYSCPYYYADTGFNKEQLIAIDAFDRAKDEAVLKRIAEEKREKRAWLDYIV